MNGEKATSFELRVSVLVCVSVAERNERLRAVTSALVGEPAHSSDAQHQQRQEVS
jgi:hypothetical protein